MDCTQATFSDAQEWAACAGEWVGPIYDVVLPIAGIAVTIAIVFAGVRVAKLVVEQFGK